MQVESSTATSTHDNNVTALLLKELRRHALRITAIAVMAGAAGVAISFLIPPQFTATSTLLPRSGGTPHGLLAALGNATARPLAGSHDLEALYPAIVRSNRILDGIVGETWHFRGADRTLHEVFGQPPPADADAAIAARHLQKHLRENAITFRQDKQTGVMELSVTIPQDPHLAATLANALTDSLDCFIVAVNGAKARESLRYVQRRLDDVDQELQIAESERTRFLEDNRTYASSPRLMQTAGELERQVQALTAVWVELVKQLEIAKLDGNRNEVALEVLDRALPPLRKSKPQRATMGVIAFVLGGAITSLIVLGRTLLPTDGR